MACSSHYERAQLRPGYYSQCIERVIAYIEEVLGFKVKRFDDSLGTSAGWANTGRTDYERELVSLNCSCAGCALLTLLHEAGHAKHFRLLGDDSSQPPRAERERMAEKLGRELSDELGFELDEEWAQWE